MFVNEILLSIGKCLKKKSIEFVLFNKNILNSFFDSLENCSIFATDNSIYRVSLFQRA